MNIKIILEGKIKEPYFKLGIEEFKKRLLKKVEVLEVSNIFEYIKNKTGAYIVTLEIEGKMLSSEEYSPTRVASCLGYPSVRQFSLMFKKITGTSPAEYKSAHN